MMANHAAVNMRRLVDDLAAWAEGFDTDGDDMLPLSISQLQEVLNGCAAFARLLSVAVADIDRERLAAWSLDGDNIRYDALTDALVMLDIAPIPDRHARRMAYENWLGAYDEDDLSDGAA